MFSRVFRVIIIINARVANGGEVPKRSRKVLEHPTGPPKTAAQSRTPGAKSLPRLYLVNVPLEPEIREKGREGGC